MDEREAAAARFRMALRMHDMGVDIMRHNLRRRMPEATEAEVSAALRAWLHAKPIPGSGDPDLVESDRFTRRS